MEPDRKLCDNLVKLSDWCFEMYVSNYTVKIRLRHAGLKYGGVRNRLRLLPYIGKENPKSRSLSAKQSKGDLEFGTWNLKLIKLSHF